MAEFRPHIEELRGSGVDVAIIGSGAPNFARGFAEHFGLDEKMLFSDEKLTSYRAADLERTAAGLLHPQVFLKGIPSMIKNRQSRTQGDALQLGGVLVVRPDGTVAWRYRSRYAGDHPADTRIRDEALKAAPGSPTFSG